MHIADFVRDCRAQWPEFGDDEAVARAPAPRDRRLQALPERIEGWATENKLMLLNLAARHLEPGEVYVEVGCWRGLTLAGAARGNPHVRIYACDDFSRMGASREQFGDTLVNHIAPGQVEFHDLDFREFLARAPWGAAKVGAYFYDGGHTFHEQFLALDLIRPHLADRALVIVDDTNDIPVRRANGLFLRYNPDFRVIADIRARSYQDPAWWNGVQVFGFERADASAARVAPAHYALQRMIWNRAVFYGQRTARLALTGRRLLRSRLRDFFRNGGDPLELQPDPGD